MVGICQDRVAIVTGAGRGIGREHALELARQGARVVVNDVGANLDGTVGAPDLAGEVVDAIRALGGEAVANGDDVADFEGAEHLVAQAIATFGGLDILVNNAGILRDRMLVNMTIDEWDAVIRVHLRGTFGPSHFAANYWRERSRSGEENDARIINTSSSSGIYGNIGQANYGAAKAGIAAFTVITSMELGRYGVTVNAIAPAARTRMTETIPNSRYSVPVTGDFDDLAADNIAPLVAWLASPEAGGVTGRVFNVAGGAISVAQGWHAGEAIDKGSRWDPRELGDVIPDLLANSPANADMRGQIPAS